MRRWPHICEIKKKTYFKIQKIIKRNVEIHLHGGNPLTKYTYAEFVASQMLRILGSHIDVGVFNIGSICTNLKCCWLGEDKFESIYKN
jgi:hypothetical protein